MENNPEYSGSYPHSSVWKKLSFLQARSIGIAVFVILTLTVPVITYVVQQQTRTQQKAFVATDGHRDDCYPLIYYPPGTAEDQDVTRYYGKSLQNQDTVTVTVGESFELGFGLLTIQNVDHTDNASDDPKRSRNLRAGERAVINFGDESKIDIIDRQSVQVRGQIGHYPSANGQDTVWVSERGDSQNRTRDLFRGRITYTQPGDYTMAFTLAGNKDSTNPNDAFSLTSEQGQINPVNPPNPHCQNGNAGGWVVRKIKVLPSQEQPGQQNIPYVIQSLIGKDGASKYRKCEVDRNPSSTSGIISSTCRQWTDFSLDPNFDGYGAFSFEHNGTQYVVQSLLRNDGQGKYRKCEIDPNSDSGIGSCPSWTDFPMDPAFDTYGTFAYAGTDNKKYVIQSLVAKNGSGKYRKCEIDPNSDSGIASSTCAQWTELSIDPNYDGFGTFSYVANDGKTYAVQSLLGKDGTGKYRKCEVDRSPSTSSGILSCDAWTAMALDPQFDAYDTFTFLGPPQTSQPQPTSPAAPTPTPDPCPNGGKISTNPNRCEYACYIDPLTNTKTNWYCTKGSLGPNARCFKTSDGSEEGCPITQPTPAFGNYTCNANGTPGHCAPQGQEPFASQCSGTWDYHGTNCAPTERCYTGCTGDTSAPVVVSCSSTGGVPCPNSSGQDPNRCLYQCQGSTQTYATRGFGNNAAYYPNCNSSSSPTTQQAVCLAAPTPTTPVVPSVTPTPTPPGPSATPTPGGNFQLNFVLLIQGVGQWSGLYDEEIQENFNPVSGLQTRQLQVEVFNMSNTRVASTTIPLKYDFLTRRYTGSTSIQPIPADSLNRYTIKIKTDGYLKQEIGQRGGPTVRILPPGSTTTINTVLAGGDVINDNALNILDYYNGFGPCFKKGHAGTCKNSDFNADSNIDLTDHKLIYDNIKHGIQF